MKRRMALALAFSLTTIVGFAIVALGSSAGFFSWSKAESQVITEYIYIDQYVASSPEAAAAEGQAPPKPSKKSKAEEGLKGLVLFVSTDGFVLRTKYGDFMLRMDEGTKTKDLNKRPITLADIQPGMLLKTKVMVQPGTYKSTNSDGSFTATKVDMTTPEKCKCNEVLS